MNTVSDTYTWKVPFKVRILYFLVLFKVHETEEYLFSFIILKSTFSGAYH